jgi:hypothetical protein
VLTWLGLQPPYVNIEALGAATLELAFRDLNFTPQQRATVEIGIKRLQNAAGQTNDGNKELAAAVQLSHLSKTFPWLLVEDKAKRQLQRFVEDWRRENAFARLREEFGARARAGTLGPYETFAGQYLLYADDADYGLYLFMAMLLRVPPADRLPLHNWAVAQELPVAVKETYGEVLGNLQVPLFPANAGLEAYNTKTLEAARERQDQATRPHADILGAGALPVVNNTVDVTAIEQFAAQVQQQLSHLQRTQQALLRRVAPTSDRQRDPPQHGRQQSQQLSNADGPPQYRQHQSQSRDAGADGVSHERGRSRGWRGGRGGRTAWGRGDDPNIDLTLDELFAPPTVATTPSFPPAKQPPSSTSVKQPQRPANF